MMYSSVSNLPGKSYSRDNIALLTVTSEAADFGAIRSIFRHDDWKLTHAKSCQEAIKAISRSAPSVIVCDSNLPDGSWQKLLQHSQSLAHPPMFIVLSPESGENLWAEVLNLGGYDVLLKPLEKSEVMSVVSMAWRHWKEAVQPRTAALAALSTALG